MDSLEVFSAYTNIIEFFEKDKGDNFSKIVYVGRLERQKLWVKDICYRIANEINNGYYSIENFKCYLIYQYFFNEKFFWNKIKTKEIPQIAFLFSKTTLDNNKTFVLELSKKTNISKMQELFEINSNGNNMLLDFIHKKYISPAFYFRFYKEQIPNSNRYEESKKQKIINKTIKKIKKNKGVTTWLKQQLKKQEQEKK